MMMLVSKDTFNEILAPKEADPVPLGCRMDNRMINSRPSRRCLKEQADMV